MNLCDLLEGCIQVERLTGQIYDVFKKQQAAFPEYAALWEKTAKEEHNHEQQFLMARRLSLAIRTAVPDAIAPPDTLVRHLAEIKARVLESPPSVPDSLRLAIAMEERLTDFHMDRIKLFPDESLQRLFIAMMNHDIDHAATLKNAYASLS